jgi:hypothetical protein
MDLCSACEEKCRACGSLETTPDFDPDVGPFRTCDKCGAGLELVLADIDDELRGTGKTFNGTSILANRVTNGNISGHH